ncbi:extracellular solute-binding protein [Rhizobiaceae bacterium BDR2-2]|uniref:Extracellular solute-binding protein n=1 Tax=Ectorhizobium quercum TaxID=2965071 RepID=A0AAE3MUZ8_9HYPH|nr:extracellular solute-binding protein [Ectorhizobium quercum]MCX8995658.1 extracellular solute-binding protein [Ectorhizobium quercum]
MAAMRMMVTGLAVLAASLIALAPAGRADDRVWRHGVTLGDEMKYPEGFARFDYVNPDAPKGGTLRLSSDGTFDSFNATLARGEVAVGVGMVFDTLLKASGDEVSTAYGLLAESLSYPDDVSEVTFRLRPEAKWADGEPVTPADVIFSFETLKEHNPLYGNYYRHVTEAVETGEREVTFRFDEKNNRELPQILGQFPIVPKHWWEGTGPDGRPRDISRTTLEPVMGSGPYRIASFSAGSTIRYELRDDYWGKDLPVNVGQNNFGVVTYTYFGDRDVEFEAFRAGNIDYWYENMAARWATGYDFPAMKDGRVLREEIENPFRATGVMQALVPNMRRGKFKDERVREALNYGFDFEELNRTIAFSAYKRVDSFFWGTELASSGLPEGREKEILEGLKDKVPERVFTTPYANPVGGDPQKSRENLRTALTLFREAGYELRGNRLVNAATGEPFVFEILLSSPTLERWAVPYAQNLRKIGVEARVRTVDPAQYTNRVRAFDYDVTWTVWAQTLHPGNEQSDYWGSVSVDRQGSKNYAGISDPAIDELIRMVTFAQTRAELVPAVHALDRVLLAHHYVMPLFYGNTARIAYSNALSHPAELPYYGTGFPDVWWSKAAAN